MSDNEKTGFTPEQLYMVCKDYDISQYALDISKKCFLKYVRKNINYKPSCYFAINNHMYLITNPACINHIVNQLKAML